MNITKLIINRIARFATAFVALTLVGFGYGLEFDSSKVSGFWKTIVDWCQSHPEVILYLAGTQILAWCIGVFVRPRPNSQRIIDENIDLALERFKESVFSDIPGSVADDENRVSLFRYDKWNWQVSLRRLFRPNGQQRGWPWSGWLVLVRRSGFLTQNRKAAFLAPDEAQYIEGVAGKGFRCSAAGAGRQGNGEENADFRLPDLSSVEYVPPTIRARHASGAGVTEEQAANIAIVECYANATSCTDSYIWGRIERKLKNPRSILAMRLVSSDNKSPWGVVVVDSFNEHDCLNSSDRKFRSAFKQLLGRLNELEITK